MSPTLISKGVLKLKVPTALRLLFFEDLFVEKLTKARVVNAQLLKCPIEVTP
jgi:hypothetical protein